MPTMIELEKLALDLPETDRAILAAALLGSLSPVLHDQDEGVAEAIKRDADLEKNPAAAITLEQLDARIASRR